MFNKKILLIENCDYESLNNLDDYDIIVFLNEITLTDYELSTLNLPINLKYILCRYDEEIEVIEKIKVPFNCEIKNNCFHIIQLFDEISYDTRYLIKKNQYFDVNIDYVEFLNVGLKIVKPDIIKFKLKDYVVVDRYFFRKVKLLKYKNEILGRKHEMLMKNYIN